MDPETYLLHGKPYTHLYTNLKLHCFQLRVIENQWTPQTLKVRAKSGPIGRCPRKPECGVRFLRRSGSGLDERCKFPQWGPAPDA